MIISFILKWIDEEAEPLKRWLRSHRERRAEPGFEPCPESEAVALSVLPPAVGLCQARDSARGSRLGCQAASDTPIWKKLIGADLGDR